MYNYAFVRESFQELLYRLQPLESQGEDDPMCPFFSEQSSEKNGHIGSVSLFCAIILCVKRLFL